MCSEQSSVCLGRTFLLLPCNLIEARSFYYFNWSFLNISTTRLDHTVFFHSNKRENINRNALPCKWVTIKKCVVRQGIQWRRHVGNDSPTISVTPLPIHRVRERERNSHTMRNIKNSPKLSSSALPPKNDSLNRNWRRKEENFLYVFYGSCGSRVIGVYKRTNL